jgi:hypothetical protein
MPLVVLDPVVLVNTGKVPDGPSAKLLTLLAYGRAIRYLNGGGDAEEQWLQQWLSPSVRVPTEPERRRMGDAYAYTFAARRALVDSIPAQGRSIDWCLAISKALIDRVVRRIGALRDSEDLELDAGVVAAAVSVHAARWIAEDWESTPDYTATGDTDANVSIHTALRAGAPLVITKLAGACEPEDPRMYYPIDGDEGYPLGATRAVHFDMLVDAFREEFDFLAIDASVLERIAPAGVQRPASVPAASDASRYVRRT